jgi:hypothetical protein
MTGGTAISSRSSLAAGLGGVCVLVGLLAPTPALAAIVPGSSGSSSTWSCGGSMVNVAVSTSGVPGAPAPITGGQSVQCAVPVVSGTSASSGGGDGGWQPVDGTHCRLTSWQPVTLTPVGAYATSPLFQFDGHWPWPDGPVHGTQS